MRCRSNTKGQDSHGRPPSGAYRRVRSSPGIRPPPVRDGRCVTSADEHDILSAELRTLRENGLALHYRIERADRRIAIAKQLAMSRLHGAIVLSTSCGHKTQERARSALLTRLLPTLEHAEHVNDVVLESRGGGDRHDRRTRDRLRRSHRITAALRIAHAPKNEPLLWPADWVASAFVAAAHHGEVEPWDVLSRAVPIDVIELPSSQ